MVLKDLDWVNLGFLYIKIDYCFIVYWKEGKWDEGKFIIDSILYIYEGLIVFYYG